MILISFNPTLNFQQIAASYNWQMLASMNEICYGKAWFNQNNRSYVTYELLEYL